MRLCACMMIKSLQCVGIRPMGSWDSWFALCTGTGLNCNDQRIPRERDNKDKEEDVKIQLSLKISIKVLCFWSLTAETNRLGSPGNEAVLYKRPVQQDQRLYARNNMAAKKVFELNEASVRKFVLLFFFCECSCIKFLKITLVVLF